MESSSFLGRSKRSKPHGNIYHVVVNCLVDGCDADLSLCRDYHRRHKVCEIHSKTPKVSIGGKVQRFCQQCSRFHSLVEFDDEKKSCRKRLEGHNRRRRKAQPDSLSKNPGPIFSSPQNANSPRLLSFQNPQILSSSMVSSSWAGPVKPETNATMCSPQQPSYYNIERQNSFPYCSSYSYKGLSQIPFIQEASTVSRPFLDSSQVLDSDRVLSLLSSAPTLNEPNNYEPHLNYNGLGPFTFGHESERVVPVTGSGKGSTSEPNQTIRFMWE